MWKENVDKGEGTHHSFVTGCGEEGLEESRLFIRLCPAMCSFMRCILENSSGELQKLILLVMEASTDDLRTTVIFKDVERSFLKKIYF